MQKFGESNSLPDNAIKDLLVFFVYYSKYIKDNVDNFTKE